MIFQRYLGSASIGCWRIFAAKIPYQVRTLDGRAVVAFHCAAPRRG
jgi:hypothetical protein